MAINDNTVGSADLTTDPTNPGGFGTELDLAGAGEEGAGETSLNVTQLVVNRVLLPQDLVQKTSAELDGEEFEGGRLLLM